MTPDWMERIACAVRGHTPDVRIGAHSRLRERPSELGDSDKTRCVWCGTTLYVVHTRFARRWK